MGDIDFRPVFDLLRQELDALSVDKPTVRIVMNPAYQKNEAKHQHRKLRKFLEVLKMPVPSPKPKFAGETDYINLELLSRIIIEPEFLFDFDDKQKKKISFSLETIPDQQEQVELVAGFHNDIVKRDKLQLTDVERVLSDIMHGDRSKRMEHSYLFRQAIGEMIRQYTFSQRVEGRIFIQLGVQYHLSNGLGIIRDLKANQDVGTFESLYFKVDSNSKAEYILEDVIVSGRTEKELEDTNRFMYYYFDLLENQMYSIEPVRFNTQVNGTVTDFSLKFHDVNFHIEPIEADHPKLELVRQARDAKDFIRSMKEDPLFDEEFQRFKEPRMLLIKASQDSAKKQKMVNMFADIEL